MLYATFAALAAATLFGISLFIAPARAQDADGLHQSKRAPVRAQGEQAAEIAYQNIVQSEAQRPLSRDPGLGRDEV